jgi:2-dehydropantoate 2-reductase
MEVISVAQKQGIQVGGSLKKKMFTNAQKARNHKTSMLQDRMIGKKMELESICGYAVRKGKELEVPVPTIETVYHVLKYLEANNQKAVSIQ